MKPISLLGVASYLPENVVSNAFFEAGSVSKKGMFTAPSLRRHVAPGETAAEMIERAAAKLVAKLQVEPARDIDILLTNVAIPDQAFTGSGAEVARRVGCRPRWIVDLHNSGCVSFVVMMDLARAIMQSSNAKGALLCNVQNAAGRVFAQEGNRGSAQAAVPGDGCGVSYLAASDQSPVLALVQRNYPECAADMAAVAPDGRQYWEPGTSSFSVGFTERKIAWIINRGNRIVPEAVQAACDQAGVRPADLSLLVTNQPNPIFLRNWREALLLPRERHHDTYDTLGNLFGAALPINLEDALTNGKLKAGETFALGGFSHAGDYAAAAVIRWNGRL